MKKKIVVAMFVVTSLLIAFVLVPGTPTRAANNEFSLSRSIVPNLASPLSVSSWLQRAKLVTSSGSYGLGVSISISRDTIVVGDNNLGAVYVYTKPQNGWSGTMVQSAKLVASDSIYSFGYSVAISGDTVVVGGLAGLGDKAYVFVKPATGWSGTLTESAKLTASDGVSTNFGESVSISGDTIVVGARWVNKAYFFVKPPTGWSGIVYENAKLMATDSVPYDYFGSASIDGDTVVVTAPWADIGGNIDQGAAYVFIKPAGGWSGMLTQTAKLTASDGSGNFYLGLSVSTNGDTIVAGGPWANGGRGAGYVFVKPPSGWSGTLIETSKLTRSNPTSSYRLGFDSVSINGDVAVIGDIFEDGMGAVYVYTKPSTGWSGTLTEVAKLNVSDSGAFGRSVANSGGTIAVGAIFGNAAYVFTPADSTPPAITIASPQAKDYPHTATFQVTWNAIDTESGVASESATLDGKPMTKGQMIDLFFLSLGPHTVNVTATDKAGNTASKSVTFTVVANIDSLIAAKERTCTLGWINSADVCKGLDDKLIAAKGAIGRAQSDTAKNQLNAFINQLDAQKGKAINQQAYDLLKTDALYVIAHLP